jgi:hypothetical protein
MSVCLTVSIELGNRIVGDIRAGSIVRSARCGSSSDESLPWKKNPSDAKIAGNGSSLSILMASR